MENNEFSLKELYSVSLKATYPIEINGQKIEPGETIAAFDKIQIADFMEVKKYATAHGGYQDANRVYWESTKEVRLNFIQGIFSQLQLALMSNARLITKQDDEVLISEREVVETDENGVFTLKKDPVGKIFVYFKENGKKLGSINGQGKSYNTGKPFVELVVDYNFKYTSSATRMVVGQRLIEGFLTLQGKTRVKDDISGKTRTGIINIPKLKLMSDLSMRLGENAEPIVGRFDAVACPSGERGNQKVMELVFLEDDIDSDM